MTIDLKNDAVLATHLRDILFRTVGYDGVESQARIDALNYYFQRPRGDEEAGASKVVSGDVSAMVEATLSQMTECLASDAIAEFHAFDKDDEHQARLETDVIQYQIMDQNTGILHLITSIKEALLFRLGVIKVWDEKFERSSIKTFEGITDRDSLAAFASVNLPKNVKLDVLDFDLKKGTAKVRQTFTTRLLRIQPIAVENFLYIEDENSETDLQRRPYVAERHIETRSSLMQRPGFDKAVVKKLSRMVTGRTRETTARTPGQVLNSVMPGIDPSQDLIEWFEVYVLLDMDGDGISERWRIALHAQDGKILEKVPTTLVPYATGTVLINPHKLRGISMYDKLRQTQDVRTGLKRALMDNATAVNQGRIAYLDGKVNVDDLDSRRADRSIRVTGVPDVNQAMTAIIIPDLTQGLLANIENERRERSEMGGAALEMASGQLRMNERMGSMGLDRAYSVMEQLSAHMTLVIAETLVRSVFKLAHETVRRNFSSEELVLKMQGRWKNIDPAQWPPRPGLTIKIAKSPNERTRRKQALKEIIDTQGALAQAGMDEVLVNLDTFHHALIDWTRASDLPNPEKYWLDPLGEESMQAREIKTASAEKDKMAQDNFMAMSVQLEQIRTALDKYQHDTTMQFNYWKEVLGAEVEEAKIVGGATTDLVKAKNDRKNANGSGSETSGNGSPDSNKPVVEGGDGKNTE